VVGVGGMEVTKVYDISNIRWKIKRNKFSAKNLVVRFIGEQTRNTTTSRSKQARKLRDISYQ
jgi:hypothetical protein